MPESTSALENQTAIEDAVIDSPPKQKRRSLFSFLKKNRSKGDGLATIAVANDGISVAHISYDGDIPTLNICEYMPCMTTDRVAVLQELIARNKLANSRFSTVLEPGNYSLHLVDAPNVQASEMKAALRWRVKELIDFNIEEAVYDIFDVPVRNLRGQGGKMMYTAVSRAPVIQSRVDLIKDCGLKLSFIDIPELAIRNIAALLDDGSGVAMLHFSAQSSSIVLSCNSTLYVARNMNIGINRLRSALAKQEESQDDFSPTSTNEYHHFIDTVILEIQRSLDYYERHSSKLAIDSLYVTPLDIELTGFTAYLAENLDISVNILNLNNILQCSKNVSDNMQVRLLHTIGAALRNE